MPSPSPLLLLLLPRASLTGEALGRFHAKKPPVRLDLVAYRAANILSLFFFFFKNVLLLREEIVYLERLDY